jgi:Zn-dependent protease with chaperone function
MGVAFKLVGLLAVLSPLVVGCAATPVGTGDQARADVALGRLSAKLQARTMRVEVSSSAGAGAYAWPDGRVLLTRGLVRLLDDEELAAAIAHELGHLISDGHAHSVVALGGTGSAGDAEARADAAGGRLLAETGYAAEAMPRMLEKVAAAGMSAACRESLRRRARALRN